MSRETLYEQSSSFPKGESLRIAKVLTELLAFASLQASLQFYGISQKETVSRRGRNDLRRRAVSLAENREGQAATISPFVQIGSQSRATCVSTREPLRHSATVLWLQAITLIWMLVECGVALFAAAAAHSPAMLAFGSDSLVELMSATVVLLQFLPHFSISEGRASRTAGVLLFALAIVVTVIAILALALHLRPATSALGIGITVAALVAMPILAWLKHREARRSNNSALAADAVQSATCAYLAVITLAGLAVNATFHIAWFDPVAAIATLPLLLREAQRAWRGVTCGCC